MKACKCCEGTCPTCKDIPNESCCMPVIMDGEWRCVIPAPVNPSTQLPSGARYDCDIFDICPIPPGTFNVEQVAALEKTIHSVMQYFPMYAVNSYMGCSCYTRIFHGRTMTCYERNVSPVMFEDDGDCPPTPDLIPKSCGCGSNSPGFLKYWTPTMESKCCPRTKVVEVVGDDGEPTGETMEVAYFPKQMFGSVPASHPHWTKYGGQGMKGLDMDNVRPDYMEKLVAMFCKLLGVIQAGGPEVTIIEG